MTGYKQPTLDHVVARVDTEGAWVPEDHRVSRLLLDLLHQGWLLKEKTMYAGCLSHWWLEGFWLHACWARNMNRLFDVRRKTIYFLLKYTVCHQIPKLPAVIKQTSWVTPWRHRDPPRPLSQYLWGSASEICSPVVLTLMKVCGLKEAKLGVRKWVINHLSKPNLLKINMEKYHAQSSL